MQYKFPSRFQSIKCNDNQISTTAVYNLTVWYRPLGYCLRRNKTKEELRRKLSESQFLYQDELAMTEGFVVCLSFNSNSSKEQSQLH
jgi:hypothetical protein